jgi:hypothetical protein
VLALASQHPTVYPMTSLLPRYTLTNTLRSVHVLANKQPMHGLGTQSSTEDLPCSSEPTGKLTLASNKDNKTPGTASCNDQDARHNSRRQRSRDSRKKGCEWSAHLQHVPNTNTDQSHTPCEPLDAQTKPSTLLGERTDSTGSAAKMVQDVVNGVKTAIQGAVAWTEKKADDLVSSEDSTGPYASPATCAVSDLDPIATGILPAAMPTQNENERTSSGRVSDRQDTKAENAEKHK